MIREGKMNLSVACVMYIRDRIRHLTFFLLLPYVFVQISSTQNVKTSRFIQFQAITSVNGDSACSVSCTPPYKSYTVDRINSCAYDCAALQCQTSSSNACVGFNYYDFEHNSTCQLFSSNQPLYFIEQVTCRYFSNVEIAGRNFAPTVCPSSFAYDGDVNGCYKSVKINLDWNTAAQYCQTLVPGGHLVFINSSKETAAMSRLTNDTSGCYKTGYYGGTSLSTWWIGLQYFDPLVNGTPPHYWKLNSETVAAPMSYTNWDTNQPDDPANEDCADLLPSLKWNDVRCSISMCFICELDL